VSHVPLLWPWTLVPLWVDANCRPIVDGPLKEFIPRGGKGPIQRLTEGNFDLERIKLVMLSHQHFDRQYLFPSLIIADMDRLVSSYSQTGVRVNTDQKR
jgi:hypothetical protein